ncbi:hypothetical protein C8T65DRAFT_837276 [Cerioporus squamosus]|nr:hypothetical protein C8T65DRAFT_837276 [Cerioporus squamosus]
MVVDDGYRIPFLRRSLCLRGEAEMEVDPLTAGMLVGVVSRITRLGKLCIDSADWLFAAVPDLPAAIASMTFPPKASRYHVRRFDLSRPETVPEEAEYRDYDDHNMNPIMLLANSRRSLERIIARSFIAADIDYHVVYPNVTHLELVTKDIFIWCFTLAFPNIRTLRVVNGEDGNWDDDLRHFNLEAQQFEGSWERLDTVVGQATHIYSVGLTCPVLSIVLDTVGPRWHEREKWALAKVIEDTQPEVLIFRMSGNLKQAEQYVARLQTIPHQLVSVGVNLRVKRLPTGRGLTNTIRRVIRATPPTIASFGYVLVVSCSPSSVAHPSICPCLELRETLAMPVLDQDAIQAALSEHPGLNSFVVRIQGQHSDELWYSLSVWS